MAEVGVPVLTGEVVVNEGPLSGSEARHLQSLERKIERGLTTFKEVGLALLEIRDKRLYRMSFPTFEAYCRSRWQMERARAYQLIGAAEVSALLPGGGPINEAQARELVPVYNHDPSLVPEVWEEVEKIVKEKGGPITGAAIRDIVRARTGAKPASAADVQGHARKDSPLTATDRLVAFLGRTVDEYSKWLASKPNNSERDRVADALAELNALAK